MLTELFSLPVNPQALVRQHMHDPERLILIMTKIKHGNC